MLRSARISALSENRNAEVIAAEQRVGRKRADERRCRSAFACERFRKLSIYCEATTQPNLHPAAIAQGALIIGLLECHFAPVCIL